ncbi:MAG: hypothetical protein M3Y80_00765, partial [Verrucomicrobiota bacterium]|nr:hypothetical protein [Verrucomicrobiota bacterium]
RLLVRRVGGVDVREGVGAGFIVDGLGPGFEAGAAVEHVAADAVIGEGVRAFPEVFLPGFGLDEADVGGSRRVAE